MVDREARDKMISAIESWLPGESKSFKFDDQIDEIAGSTDDETVKSVRKAVWYFYDDVYDKIVNLQKDDWDYIQRLLLILHSDAEWFEEKQPRHFSLTNVLALSGFFVFFCTFYFLGFLIACFFSGITGLAIYLLRFSKEDDSKNQALTPFNSLTQMMKLRKSVFHFCKTPYPGEESNVTDIARFTEKFYTAIKFFVLFFITCFLSPGLLLNASFPSRETIDRLVLPEEN